MQFQSKVSAVMDLQLKVQRLTVSNKDAVYAANGGNNKFSIGENVRQVLSVVHVDDSGSALVVFPASSVSISSGDITVTGLALANNDVVQLEYILD
jgi:hypothetical protein